MKSVFTDHFRTLVFAALMVGLVFAGLNIAYRLATERLADTALFSVLVNDQTLILDGKSMQSFNADLARLSATGHQAVSDHMKQWIDRWVDDTFGLATAALPGYMDWYYSMPGSYTRLYFAVSGDLDSKLQERMRRHIVDNSGLEMRMQAFRQELGEELQAVLASQGEALREQLAGMYHQRQADVGVAGAQPDLRLNVDTAIHLAFFARPEDIQRWQNSAQAGAAAGVGTLALLTGRALMPRLMALSSVQGARRIVAGFAARLAPRMAMAVSAGGSAAAVAAPTGPGALVAGGVAFITAAGTLVITDFALLKAEEAILRETKQQEILDELIASRESTRQLLQVQMQRVTATVGQALWQGLAQPYNEAGLGERFHILGNRG